MTWCLDGEDETEGGPRVDHGEDGEGRGITIVSDADDTVGQYSRDVPISFRESRRQTRVSREAAESRGETVDESPLLDLPNDEGSVEGECGDADGSISTDSVLDDEDVDEEAFGEYLCERLENGLDSTDVAVLATGNTHSTSYSFIETLVAGEKTYAMIESASTGVVYRERLGNYGTEINAAPVAFDTERFVDAIAGERKHMKRAYLYRTGVDVVSELSYEQVSTIQTYYREVATDLLEDVLVMSDEERDERGVEVSVVDNCVVASGPGVTAALEQELEWWLSEKQLDVILDEWSGAVQGTEEQISRGVQSEIRRQATLSGECVVCGWVFLE
jgi:hypothetical protein